MATGQELTIDRSANAQTMAETIFGDDVTIVGATYVGDVDSSGVYSDGDSISPEVTPGDSGVILSTGDTRGFTRGSGDPNRSTGTTTASNGPNNDADFNAVAGTNTFDASWLEVDFIPENDLMTMQFTFASEEYPEYTGSIFNDVVGIWVNGALVTSPVVNITQINSVNQSENETLFVDNTRDDFNTEMDGFTVTLTVVFPVDVGEVNTLKVGIADVGDSAYDSAVLIAADSVQGSFVAQDDTITVWEQQVAVIDVLDNDGSGGVMFITHVNGIEVNTGDTVTLSSGHEITLLADGSLEVVPPASQVGITDPTTVNFTYTAENGDGITDTAFVTVTAIPCFARGTMIRTPDGEVPVERIRQGDLVETRDDGAQPVRWIGCRTVVAEGTLAPVVIEPGTFGMHRRLVVSPQHRVLLTHWRAEILFGEDEILVAAKDLVNDCSVWRREGGTVEYFHLLFDAHQVIWSEWLPTESFHPGPTVLSEFDAASRAEVLRLFPEIDARTYLGYGPAARAGIRAYEARAMLG